MAREPNLEMKRQKSGDFIHLTQAHQRLFFQCDSSDAQRANPPPKHSLINGVHHGALNKGGAAAQSQGKATQHPTAITSSHPASTKADNNAAQQSNKNFKLCKGVLRKSLGNASPCNVAWL